ncbi:hypothetical protein C8Q79DRAFT_1002795 [Trametes meyenii]|nr:hypothetical protein C8Q79DRAFT_1002795 [Trametes meyenii]
MSHQLDIDFRMVSTQEGNASVVRFPTDYPSTPYPLIYREVFDTPPQPAIINEVRVHTYRAIPRLSRGQDRVFRALWSLQYPMVVHRVDDGLQARWSPEAFTTSHGNDDVLMIDSRSGVMEWKKVKASEFFSEFIRTDIVRGSVKLKDWPPSASFLEEFKYHYDAFMSAVPMPSYTRDNGFKNLAAHLPDLPKPHRSLKPDLGPKMYLATRDIDGLGSTALHLDITSAVNILVYASDGDPPGSIWHIFLASDLERLRGYLRSLPGGQAHTDPIQAQTTYLTPGMLRELCLLGVKPFEVHQRYGEAIFIPAGCAHQVSNTSACIKIACDFLCVEGIYHSARVSEEIFRGRQEDLLGLESMLWHAWVSLREMSQVSVALSTQETKTRKERKRHNQRHTVRGQDDLARRKQERRGWDTANETDATLRCPDPACATSVRKFRVLDGVFNHL